MEYKSFAFEATEVDLEQGVVKGFCAVMGNIDDGGDRIPLGACRKTIAERGLRIKGGWQHDLDMPFAKTTAIREVGRDELPAQIIDRAPNATGGIYVEGKVSLNSINRDRLQLVKDGLVDEMSIGYVPVQEKFVKAADGQTIRELSEIKLFEWSCVTLGMNPAAQVVEAKRARQTKAGKAPEDTAWDGPGEVAKAGVSDLKAMCAVVDGDGSTKSDYHLPHHLADDGHPVVLKGVIAAGNALVGGRGGYQGPDAGKAKTHLEAHYHAFDRKAPWESDEKATTVDISDSGTHGAFTGSHSHAHDANGAQGDDAMHTHSHAHDGNGDHGHDHAKRARLFLSRKSVGDHFDYIRQRVRDALQDAYPWQPGMYDYYGGPMMTGTDDRDGPGCCIQYLYADSVVVSDQDYDSLWDIPYTLAPNGDVTLGTPALVKVVMQTLPAGSEEAEDAGLKALRLATETKAGRRNSRPDESRLKAAHDALHDVLNIPHHGMDGAPAEGDDADAGSEDDASAKAMLELRFKTIQAQMRASGRGAA